MIVESDVLCADTKPSKTSIGIFNGHGQLGEFVLSKVGSQLCISNNSEDNTYCKIDNLNEK